MSRPGWAAIFSFAKNNYFWAIYSIFEISNQNLISQDFAWEFLPDQQKQKRRLMVYCLIHASLSTRSTLQVVVNSQVDGFQGRTDGWMDQMDAYQYLNLNLNYQQSLAIKFWLRKIKITKIKMKSAIFNSGIALRCNHLWQRCHTLHGAAHVSMFHISRVNTNLGRPVIKHGRGWPVGSYLQRS